ncbi:MAG: stage 0 sporulation protein [Anaerolineae bacterium]|nr:stage 0 sporulation protein [Anaerolineae bacterium]
MTTAPEQQRKVAGIRFHRVGKLYHFEFDEYPQLQMNDYVIVETARGRQMGQVVAFAPAEADARDYKSIMRMATPRDLLLKQHWEGRQQDAMDVLLGIVNQHGGYPGVKFVAALFNYDGTTLTFLYSTEDKVNLSRLWNDVSREFDAHVELRQIGPRDVAKLLGGFGACGELRCCSTFLTDFSPISIKMAKMQGISLNPSEITGMCGRLRCCLVYEYEQYVQARAKLPKRNKRIGTPHGEGKVVDVHPLQDAVTVYVGESYHLVQREDLVPLEELEALAKKAKEPCTKHGDGPCECGAKPGKTVDEVDNEDTSDESPEEGADEL